MEEEGSAHFVKENEMGAFEDDEEANVKIRNFHKGSSLPKPSVNRQYSFQRILKTLSLSPYERHPSWPYEEDVGKGEKNHSWLWGFNLVENLEWRRC